MEPFTGMVVSIFSSSYSGNEEEVGKGIDLVGFERGELLET